jgi:lipoate-protein ligase A
MKAVEKYLTPNSKKLQSKGVSSVCSRVMNLNELNTNVSHEALQEPLIEEFCKQYSPNETCLVSFHFYEKFRNRVKTSIKISIKEAQCHFFLTL